MSLQNESELIQSLLAERDIVRLINSYPYLLDNGKFDEVATLLQHATLEAPGHKATGRDEIEQFLTLGIQKHQDGTPRTWHAVSNILVDVDQQNEQAKATSYFTVHQQLPDFSLQPICTGHYKDCFAMLNN